RGLHKGMTQWKQGDEREARKIWKAVRDEVLGEVRARVTKLDARVMGQAELVRAYLVSHPYPSDLDGKLAKSFKKIEDPLDDLEILLTRR
ncbi:MAG: hypothetical protein U0904_10195, partial [Candidatus Nanopelagicales bacterium]|nr:hypothetical protein [Candidatus Nanopelagicales bacterium]